MSFINVDATYKGKFVDTKKNLKQLIATVPEEVRLESNAMFPPFYSGVASEVNEGHKFTVVGPDPYKSRKWYATVEKRNGKLVVT